MFGIVKNRVDKKLSKLGIFLNYSIKPSEEESTINRTKSTVYLNKKDIGYSGFARASLEHLLLHEIGHLFFWNIPAKTTKSRPFQNIFGEVYKYYRRDMGRKHDANSFISKYAQTHPRENFAEIFAIYVHFEGDMHKIGKFLLANKKNLQVLHQLQWLDSFVKQGGRTKISMFYRQNTADYTDLSRG